MKAYIPAVTNMVRKLALIIITIICVSVSLYIAHTIMYLLKISVTPDKSLKMEFIIVACLIITVLIIGFSKEILPSVRTVFRIDRHKNSPRLYYTGLISICILSFAIISWKFDIGIERNDYYLFSIIGSTGLFLTALGAISVHLLPKESPHNEERFALDEPQELPAPSPSQKRAVEELSVVLSFGYPRSVSLTGEWGIGKTSVLESAIRDVENNVKNIIWVRFEPWRYASEEALISAFYERLAAEIDTIIPGYQNILGRIKHAVNQIIKKTEKTTIQDIVNMLDISSVSKNKYPDKFIGSVIDREARRIVVIVDNIERQYDQKNIYRSLQLVHHLKSISSTNVQTLLIYDKLSMQLGIPDHLSNSAGYLEKFSEIEISLPTARNSMLRNHLNTLVDKYKTLNVLPNNFSLDPNNYIVSDIKSYRGIISIFNRLLLQFYTYRNKPIFQNDSDANSNIEVNTINYDDNFMMEYLNLKYPVIYKDIDSNRGLYTSSKIDEQNIRLMLMDPTQIEEDGAKHFKVLFEQSKLSDEQKEYMKDILTDLFPNVGIYFGNSKSHIGEHTMKFERRVADRDVLDSFFALTQSMDEYDQFSRWIKNLITEIKNEGDRLMISTFKEYMGRFSKTESPSNGITLLRRELTSGEIGIDRLKALRAWMRAVLSISDVSIENESSYLGQILSAMNEVIISIRNEDEQVIQSSYIFEDLNKYLNDPRTALLLMLYLLPERGNSYFVKYIQNEGFKKDGLYVKVLKWVENHFTKKSINLYEIYDYSDWIFVSYQWALSISSDNNGINDKVPNSSLRYSRVTKKLLNMLKTNSDIAYTMLLDRFWKDKLRSPHNEELGWYIDNNVLAPFGVDQIIDLVEFLIKDVQSLSDKEHDLEALLTKLNGFKAKHPKKIIEGTLTV